VLFRSLARQGLTLSGRLGGHILALSELHKMHGLRKLRLMQ